MKIYKYFKTIINISISFILLCSVTGCSLSSENVDSYKKNMNQFFDNVEALNDAINSIDTSSENYSEELLIYLDQLNTTFLQMSKLTVPTKFTGVPELAEDAAKNMDEAVISFHEALENDYNADAFENGYISYRQANAEIKYIIRILHGEKFEDLFE